MSKQLEEILNDIPHSIRFGGNLEELVYYAKEQAERADSLAIENSKLIKENNKINHNLTVQTELSEDFMKSFQLEYSLRLKILTLLNDKEKLATEIYKENENLVMFTPGQVIDSILRKIDGLESDEG